MGLVDYSPDAGLWEVIRLGNRNRLLGLYRSVNGNGVTQFSFRRSFFGVVLDLPYS
jgi:hypothetical protein